MSQRPEVAPRPDGADRRYDALLYTSFGGPEGPEDVLPFLRNVTAGRDVPDERLEEVAEHYHHFGGRSPINEQNLAVIEALERRFAEDGPDLPIYFGNRNWDPLLADTLRRMADDGVRRALAFVTSAYSSYSGCRQYRENLAAAAAQAGVDIEIDKIRVFYNHPGFVEAQTARVEEVLPEGAGTADRVLFVTHSIPRSMARHSDYEVQTYEASRLVMERLDPVVPWEVVFSSRSGPPHVPWLEPDVNDRITELAEAGVERLVVVPIGFVSDHLEVLFDLDVEAAETAAEVGVEMRRAGTVGVHPAYLDMIRDLVLERLTGAPRESAGTRGPNHDACPADCCLRPGQAVAPTVAGAPPAPAR